MKTFWYLLVQFFLYSLLFFIICLAAVLWFIRQAVLAIGHRPKAFVGTAAGGSSIVKIWARTILSILKAIRGYLGKHVKDHHPRVYRTLFRLFQ